MKVTKFTSLLFSLSIIVLPLTVSNVALASEISPQALKTTLNRTLAGTYDEGTWGGKGRNDTWNHSWTMVGGEAVELNDVKEIDGEFIANLKIAWGCKHTRENYNAFAIKTSEYDDRYSGYITAEVTVGTIAGETRIYVNKINNSYRNFRCGNTIVNKLTKLNTSILE